MRDRALTIPGGEGASCQVEKGDRLRVIDVDGQQVADFLAFNAQNLREKSSPAETINFNLTVRPSVGDRFYSNLGKPMFEIAVDMTGGLHDLLHAACSSPFYAHHGAGREHRNCRDNLAAAMREHGVEQVDLPDPINLFQHTWPGPAGRIEGKPGSAKAGEYVELTALIDCIVAVSACPFDLDLAGESINGEAPTPIRLEINRSDEEG